MAISRASVLAVLVFVPATLVASPQQKPDHMERHFDNAAAVGERV